jgi:PKD repeat protein
MAMTIAAAVSSGSCTIKKADEQSLTGPSELGLSIAMTANPDVLYQDGASQSLIQIQARRANSQPASSVALRAEITVDGTIVDFGRLSARNLVTDNEGRANLIYTAPPYVGDPVDTGLFVTIQVTPAESDNRNAFRRQLDIRLVPPGVVLPPTDAPVPKFTISPGNPAIGDSVVFDASGSTDDGAIVSYAWDYGDGSRGTGRVVTHPFRTPGTFAVTLTVTDDRGKSATLTQNVQVSGGILPTASFTFSPASPVIHQTIVFNAAASTAAPGREIVRYDWNFGSGNPQSGQVVNKEYDVPGVYNVTLTVTDDVGNKGTTTQSVSVGTTGGNNPVPDFTFSPTNPLTNQAVFFNASSSTAPGATIVSYAWDFGDGALGNGQTTNHTYTSAFTFVVRLAVTDSTGRVGQVTKTLTVTAPTPPPTPVPTAAFTFSPAQPDAGQNVFFDASPSSPGTGATITSSRWNFGDGTFGTGVTPPAKVYPVNGASGATTSYNVRLTVTNSAGQSATATQTVTVRNP